MNRWNHWDPGWMVSLALGISLLAQTLVQFGQHWAGFITYGIGLGLLVWMTSIGADRQLTPLPETARGLSRLIVFGILLAALWLRVVNLQTIPWGLNNDEGIEGLIACRFLSGVPLSPFSDIGLSRETLYHVLLMPIIHFFGPKIEALRLLSAFIGVLSVYLIYWTGKQFFSVRVGVLSAALLAFSPWHILYSRTGFRNILLPMFVLGCLGLFHRALAHRKLHSFVLTGIILGLGMYSYTSFRVFPLILLIWALSKRYLFRETPLSWKQVSAVVLPFFLLLIPQIAYAMESPAEFLMRGRYVLTQTPNASISANLFYSWLMPVIYPDRFGVVQSLHYFGDGVSLVYAAVGRTPETIVSGALMACGFILLCIRVLRDRSEPHLVLLLAYLTSLLTVGLAGPSLTRLIANLPLLCLMGGLFLELLGTALNRFKLSWIRRPILAGLLLASFLFAYDQYFTRAGQSEKAMFYYAYPQTLIGHYVAAQPPGHPVFVFYTEQPEALQFLTYARRKWTVLYTEPDQLDLEKIREVDSHIEIVMEGHRKFLNLFTTLARLFPWANPSFLGDAKHFPDRRVVYLLDVHPPQSPPSPEVPPGNPPPTP